MRFLDFARNDKMALGRVEVSAAEIGMPCCVNVSFLRWDSARYSVAPLPLLPPFFVMSSDAETSHPILLYRRSETLLDLARNART
ncbi:MAG: hypothetical protein QOH24_1835 [Verrucomicrobiota bacterium]